MHFKIIGPIMRVESIAAGTAEVEFHDGAIAARKFIGTKRMASERRNIRLRGFLTK